MLPISQTSMWLQTGKGDRQRSCAPSPFPAQAMSFVICGHEIRKPNVSAITKRLFCCVRFIYTYPTKQHRTGAQDPAPLFVQGAEYYVHILHVAFVALDILEV